MKGNERNFNFRDGLNSGYLVERLILRFSTISSEGTGGGKLWNSLKFLKCSGSSESSSSCWWLFFAFLVMNLFSVSIISFCPDSPRGVIDDVILFVDDEDVFLVWHMRLGI